MIDRIEVLLNIQINRKVVVETILLTLYHRIMRAATGTIPE